MVSLAFYFATRAERNIGRQTQATVSQLLERKYYRRNSLFYAVFEFQGDHQETIRVTNRRGYPEGKFQVGDVVDIVVPTQDPTQAFILDFTDWAGVIFFGGFGFILGMMGWFGIGTQRKKRGVTDVTNRG